MTHRIAPLFAAAVLAAGAASAAEMKGWISDSTCGVGNASSESASRECAARCLKNGAAPVFVSEKEQKVYQLSDAEAAKKHLAGKVVITGEVKGDRIEIAKIVDVKE